MTEPICLTCQHHDKDCPMDYYPKNCVEHKPEMVADLYEVISALRQARDKAISERDRALAELSDLKTLYTSAQLIAALKSEPAPPTPPATPPTMPAPAPAPKPSTLDAAQAVVQHLNGEPRASDSPWREPKPFPAPAAAAPLPPGISAMPSSWHAALVRLGRAACRWRRSLEQPGDAERMLALHELLSATEAYERVAGSGAPRCCTASSESKQNPDGTYSDAEAM